MIQVDEPMMIGVTFDAPALNVAARIFDSAGNPVTGWMVMTNYDGNSYNVFYTFLATGAFSIKKVVFDDPGFTTRDPNYSEADDAVQVVSASGGSGVAVGPAGIIGIVQDNDF